MKKHFIFITSIIVFNFFIFFPAISMRQAIAEEKHDHEEKNGKVSKKESHDEHGHGDEVHQAAHRHTLAAYVGY